VQTGPNSLLRWNGTGWTQIPGPTGATGRPLEFSVVSANQIYAVGDSAGVNRAFYRFDGTTWREVGRSAFATGLVTRPWADPRGGAFVASAANNAVRVDQVTATGVAPVSFRPSFRDVTMPSPSNAFVVGANALLARLVGSNWIVDAPPAGTTANVILQGVWADGASNAWAVGSNSSIMRWDGTRWNVVSDARRPVATADNYNAVWGGGGSVWAVGDATILRCRTATTCTNDAPPAGGALYGVWGTSATNVFAVGNGGRILRFDGTNWTSMQSRTGARLTRVWGSAPNDVWATGDTTVIHFDGTTWTNQTQAVLGSSQNYRFYTLNSTIGFQTALWGASSKEIYAGTLYGSINRGSGSFWGEMDGPFNQGTHLVGIAGSAGGCALAVSDGYGLSGPLLLRGFGPNGCLSSATTGPSSLP
jgi:hypothetical protein